MAQKEKVEERAGCPGRIHCSDAVTQAVFSALNHPGWIWALAATEYLEFSFHASADVG